MWNQRAHSREKYGKTFVAKFSKTTIKVYIVVQIDTIYATHFCL